MPTDITWPETIPSPLVNAVFVSNPRNIRTVMETGRVRNRRGFATTLDTYEAAWAFTEDQYAIFREFFNATLENGTLTFMLPMQDDSELEVGFMKCTYQFNRTDNLYSVKAVLEVAEEPVVDIFVSIEEIEA